MMNPSFCRLSTASATPSVHDYLYRTTGCDDSVRNGADCNNKKSSVVIISLWYDIVMCTYTAALGLGRMIIGTKRLAQFSVQRIFARCECETYINDCVHVYITSVPRQSASKFVLITFPLYCDSW